MNSAQEKSLPLTLEPQLEQLPAIHSVFVEKRGNILSNARVAWTELHAKLPAVSEYNHVTGYLSLYKMDKEIYRAGVTLAATPEQLPAGLTYENLAGGKYIRFVLRGPYSQLPDATTQAVQTMRDMGALLRDDFNIERYITDPRTTPEDQLITEILFPVA